MTHRGSYNTEGYVGGAREAERVAGMIRSLMQDATRDFKKETIDILFPEKKIDDIDIGQVSSRWVKNILCSLQNNEEKQVKLILLVWIKYNKGINLDKDKTWHMIWIKIGLPLFSDKINDLPATGRVAPMASLKKPEKREGRDIRTVKW